MRRSLSELRFPLVLLGRYLLLVLVLTTAGHAALMWSLVICRANQEVPTVRERAAPVIIFARPASLQDKRGNIKKVIDE